MKSATNLRGCFRFREPETLRENKGELSNELRVSILKKAAKYEKEGIEKNKKENPYHNANLDDKN